jgi:CheY-like chemotaxis protein
MSNLPKSPHQTPARDQTFVQPGLRAKDQGFLARAGALATLSHEIRTPLNGVLGMAGLLAETALDDTQKSYLAALHASGEHLLTLVNDILDLAKLESGRLELESAELDLEVLLQGVAELLSPRAHASGVEIAWSVSRNAPRILADDGRLRQILFNLAGNAVKMTALHHAETNGAALLHRRGGVLIQGVARPMFGDRVRLRLSVRDSGPGVSEAASAHIFEEFTQDAAGARAGGAGLGLAIVRRIAEALGAEVGVTNMRQGPEDYWGAEFWLEADFALAPGAQIEMTSTLAASVQGLPLAGRTVAVISECPVVREAALAQIRASGARALLTSGFEALERMHDAVLVDQTADGEIRSPPPGVKALVLLSPEQRGHIDRYRAAGYAGYLIKPLRRASIIARLEALLHLTAKSDGDGAAEARRADERDSSLRAGEGLKVLLAEDNAVNALLATSLLKRAGCVVTRVINGEEAVEAALSSAFDLVLMDVRMPVMDGMEATRRLREAGCSTPIAALTANAFEDDRRACLEAGMNHFLTKPIAPAALNALIAEQAHATDEAARRKTKRPRATYRRKA